MTSILIVDVIGLVLFGWVLNLIRKGSVYVRYGAPLLTAIGGTICVASVPARFVQAFTQRIGKVKSGSLAVFLTIYCVLLILTYLLGEITVISRRLHTLAQQLAIELARHDGAVDSAEPLRQDESRARSSHSDGA